MNVMGVRLLAVGVAAVATMVVAFL